MSDTITIDIPALVRQRIIKHLAPDDVVDVIQKYAHGKCAHFAIALCELSGQTDVFAFVIGDGTAKHFAVVAGDRLFDAYGVTSVRKIQDRYSIPLRPLRVPVEHIKGQLSEKWESEKEGAIAAVLRLARHYKWRVTK